MDMYWPGLYSYHAYQGYVEPPPPPPPPPIYNAFFPGDHADGGKARLFGVDPYGVDGRLTMDKEQVTAVHTQMFKKTRMCKFWVDGDCREGDFCSFAHGEEEKLPPPDLFRSELCYGIAKMGRCTYGPKCKFAHSEAEIGTKYSRRPRHARARSADKTQLRTSTVSLPTLSVNVDARGSGADGEGSGGVPKRPDEWLPMKVHLLPENDEESTPAKEVEKTACETETPEKAMDQKKEEEVAGATETPEMAMDQTKKEEVAGETETPELAMDHTKEEEEQEEAEGEEEVKEQEEEKVKETEKEEKEETTEGESPAKEETEDIANEEKEEKAADDQVEEKKLSEKPQARKMSEEEKEKEEKASDDQLEEKKISEKQVKKMSEEEDDVQEKKMSKPKETKKLREEVLSREVLEARCFEKLRRDAQDIQNGTGDGGCEGELGQDAGAPTDGRANSEEFVQPPSNKFWPSKRVLLSTGPMEGIGDERSVSHQLHMNLMLLQLEAYRSAAWDLHSKAQAFDALGDRLAAELRAHGVPLTKSFSQPTPMNDPALLLRRRLDAAALPDRGFGGVLEAGERSAPLPDDPDERFAPDIYSF